MEKDRQARGGMKARNRMTRYRKKPIVIEAIHWSGANYKDIVAFVGKQIKRSGDNVLLIRTLEGTMQANIDDWIIRGVMGELYPCKPGIFDATYEAVHDDAQVDRAALHAKLEAAVRKVRALKGWRPAVDEMYGILDELDVLDAKK